MPNDPFAQLKAVRQEGWALFAPLGIRGQIPIPSATFTNSCTPTVTDKKNIAGYTNAAYREAQMSITTVFVNNRGQAVRLPPELRLPDSVRKVNVRARGSERIISPVGQTWDHFFQNGPRASDDFLPERASQTLAERDAL